VNATVPPSTSTFHALEHLGPHALLVDVWAFVLILLAVFGIGLALVDLIGSTDEHDPVGEMVVLTALGLVGYGAVVFVIGFLPLLHTVPLTLVSVVSGAIVVWRRRRAWHLARRFAAPIWNGLRTEWVIAVPTIAVLAIIFLAGFRPPEAPDEIAYHWPAPLLWAHTGHWVKSPFRFTNGFFLAEVIYTVAAVFRTSTAAHWTDSFTFVLLALGTAALARRFGGTGALATAGVLAVPVAAGESPWAYNDVFAASLLVAACVAVARRPDLRCRLTAGILTAGALSVKPILIFMVPAVALFAMNGEREKSGDWSWTGQARTLIPIALPGGLSSLGWLVYSKLVTGVWFQGKGFVVDRFGHDPSHGLATIRLPTLIDALLIPTLPVVTGIFGNEPEYGGRTGLVLVVFIPVMVVTAFVMSADDRHRLGRITVPGLVAYLIAAVLIVRTRYLIPVYCVAIAASTVSLAWWRGRSPRRVGPILIWIFRLCVVAGLIDEVRHIVG
jgi:hypothetical protein